MQSLGVELARYLQSVANLITANRRDRVRVFFAVDFAVIKTFVLQFLLSRFNGRVRPCRGQSGKKNEGGDKEFTVHRQRVLGRLALTAIHRVGRSTARG